MTDTDIIAESDGTALILVIMYVETFTTDVNVFISVTS